MPGALSTMAMMVLAGLRIRYSLRLNWQAAVFGGLCALIAKYLGLTAYALFTGW